MGKGEGGHQEVGFITDAGGALPISHLTYHLNVHQPTFPTVTLCLFLPEDSHLHWHLLCHPAANLQCWRINICQEQLLANDW